MLKRQNRRVYMVAFMDDNSRFITGYGIHASQSAALVLEVVRAAIVAYGTPQEMLTDNGSQYVTWRGTSAFHREMDKRGIKHIVARPQHPQTLGKIERFWGTLWRECIETSVFFDLDDARRRIGHFIDYYNFQRVHRGIDGLVPADRFFGAAAEVLATLRARVAANALELARNGVPKAPFYVTGRIGERAFSVHAEGEKMILKREGQGRTEVDLGGPAGTTQWSAELPLVDGGPSGVSRVFRRKCPCRSARTVRPHPQAGTRTWRKTKSRQADRPWTPDCVAWKPRPKSRRKGRLQGVGPRRDVMSGPSVSTAGGAQPPQPSPGGKAAAKPRPGSRPKPDIRAAVSREAQRVAVAILEVLAGVRTPTEAAVALSLSVPRYYLWEQRALEGLVRACEPRPQGKAASERHQIAVLEKEVHRLRQDCARQQALVRASQRTIGLGGPPQHRQASGQAQQQGDRQNGRHDQRQGEAEAEAGGPGPGGGGGLAGPTCRRRNFGRFVFGGAPGAPACGSRVGGRDGTTECIEQFIHSG